jgi:membrane protease YdiL (CAAX protease family)
MAFAFSWIAWAPWVLSEDGVGLLPYKLGAATGLLNGAAILLGPAIAAFIMTATTEGRAGIRRLLRRIVLWRVGLRWYLFALVGIPVILVLGAVVLPGALASFQMLSPSWVWFYPVAVVSAFFMPASPLAEETGWRGFALPRLQRLHGPLVGSLVLGAALGTVAPAHILVAGSPNRSVCPHGYRHDHRLYMGLQQHARQRAYGHLAARFH